MRISNILIPTLRDAPGDAEIVSHKLMVRAGMIRQLASGIYTWLPLGLRVLRKVERIVREEMDGAGAQEVLMSGVLPAELWQESGRWDHYGPELLRIKDRHDRAFVIGPTHEEVITDLARRELKSYRQLPVNFYEIQMKGVGVLHQKFARTHDAEARPDFVTKLGLDLIEVGRQLLVAVDHVADEVGDRFFVGGP